MTVQPSYEELLTTSQSINWRIEDIIGGDKKLNFGRRFLPESFARVDGLDFLNDDEKRMLNQIRGHGYLYTFGLVEEFILPFVIDHTRPQLDGDDYQVRAMLQFAAEEAKHIHLFKQFRTEFCDSFGVDCGVIGPPEAIAGAVLAHAPLAVALLILHIEWMTQRHFVDSARDDGTLDEQFKSLLRHHWMEECQHAQLDMKMVEDLAATCSAEEKSKAIEEYLEIGRMLDGGMRQQAEFDLASFEEATGRTLTDAEREVFIDVQHQALRWTFIGSGMTHPRFTEALRAVDAEGAQRVANVAPAFC